MHGSGFPLVYVYGSLEAANFSTTPPGVEFDVALRQMMMGYWISFTTSEDSNPNDVQGVKRGYSLI